MPTPQEETKGWGHGAGDRECRGADKPQDGGAASLEPPVLPAGPSPSLNTGGSTVSSKADGWLKEAFGDTGEC